MKKRSHDKSVPGKILELGEFLKTPKTAEDIKRELKDSFGYNIGIVEVSRSLLRLLRKKEIKRKKDDKVYKYYKVS